MKLDFNITSSIASFARYSFGARHTKQSRSIVSALTFADGTYQFTCAVAIKAFSSVDINKFFAHFESPLSDFIKDSI